MPYFVVTYNYLPTFILVLNKCFMKEKENKIVIILP